MMWFYLWKIKFDAWTVHICCLHHYCPRIRHISWEFFAIDSLGQIGRVAFLAELGENLGRDGLKYWPSWIPLADSVKLAELSFFGRVGCKSWPRWVKILAELDSIGRVVQPPKKRCFLRFFRFFRVKIFLSAKSKFSLSKNFLMPFTDFENSNFISSYDEKSLKL